MPRLHYWLTAALALLLPLACYATRLRFEVPGGLAGFLLGWAIQSIVWAGLLYQLGMKGAWSELRHGWKRFIVAAALPAIVLPLAGIHLNSVLVCVAGIIGMEFYYRRGNWKAIGSALWPWGYLAFGIELAIIYNCAIVSVRHFNLYDWMFERWDAAAFGISVTRLGHAAMRLDRPAETIYYAMGGTMGAAILFLCVAGERREAFRMTGTILTSYYISLLIFAAWPSQGPFSLHATGFGPQMVTGEFQRLSYINAGILYHHRNWLPPAAGYFVAFPSMHVAQPLIAGWFLRRWRVVSLLVFGYCALLIPAILILQWHYFVDIVAGILVAAFATVLLKERHPMERGGTIGRAEVVDCAAC